MASEAAWLLLRIPRARGAKVMSGVLGVAEWMTSARGANIPAVCDALLAAAMGVGRPVSSLMLVFPLDGRHDLAHVALEEANRRGWQFARHVPRGQEAHLLDLDGADAADAWESLDALAEEFQHAVERSELGEALAILRCALALRLRHVGAWDAGTMHVASDLVEIAARTGAEANLDEAAGLVEHLLAQPFPTTFEDPLQLLAQLEETAHQCMAAERPELAVQLLDRSVDVARHAFSERDESYLGARNNRALLLAAIDSPDAEPALRELLLSARALLGEQHPNVAVVLANLAEHLERHGRSDEAAPLRAEADAIRSATP
jgi:hypothetical protein